MFDGKVKDGKVRWKNLRWDNFVYLLDGPMTKSFFLIPVFGYLIIFKDYFIESADFSTLVGNEKTTFVISPGSRVRFVYFGMIFVGIAYAIYLLRRPSVMSRSTNQAGYLEFAKRNFTFRNYEDIYDEICKEGAYSIYGEDHLDQWEDFKILVGGKEFESSKKVYGDKVHFTETQSRFEGMIRALVIDYYIRGVRSRRSSLILCIFLAMVGYLLIIIPSGDLFARVVQITFF